MTGRRFLWPLPDLWRGASLSDEEIRRYNQFRLSFMALKPQVNPEEDYARFAAWVKSAPFVWLARDRSGQLLGTTCFQMERRTHDGRDCVLVRTEYVYISPEIRKAAGPALGLALAVLLGASRAPGRPVYLVGSGYLPSFMAIAQVFQHSWFRPDPGMTPWEQRLWHTLAAETRGYDPATQLIEMDTVPREPRQLPPRDPALLPRYQAYLAHNPRWIDGKGCLSFVRVRPGDLGGALWKLVERLLPRSSPGLRRA